MLNNNFQWFLGPIVEISRCDPIHRSDNSDPRPLRTSQRMVSGGSRAPRQYHARETGIRRLIDALLTPRANDSGASTASAAPGLGRFGDWLEDRGAEILDAPAETGKAATAPRWGRMRPDRGTFHVGGKATTAGKQWQYASIPLSAHDHRTGRPLAAYQRVPLTPDRPARSSSSGSSRRRR